MVLISQQNALHLDRPRGKGGGTLRMAGSAPESRAPGWTTPSRLQG